MHFPEQEQCFAAFKIDNGHVWQLASNSNFITYQLEIYWVIDDKDR